MQECLILVKREILAVFSDYPSYKTNILMILKLKLIVYIFYTSMYYSKQLSTINIISFNPYNNFKMKRKYNEVISTLPITQLAGSGAEN